ncbi:MAG: hypothetical protein V4579_05850 [Pseudomonadota bacterium]
MPPVVEVASCAWSIGPAASDKASAVAAKSFRINTLLKTPIQRADDRGTGRSNKRSLLSGQPGARRVKASVAIALRGLDEHLLSLNAGLLSKFHCYSTG